MGWEKEKFGHLYTSAAVSQLSIFPAPVFLLTTHDTVGVTHYTLSSGPIVLSSYIESHSSLYNASLL